MISQVELVLLFLRQARSGFRTQGSTEMPSMRRVKLMIRRLGMAGVRFPTAGLGPECLAAIWASTIPLCVVLTQNPVLLLARIVSLVQSVSSFISVV